MEGVGEVVYRSRVAVERIRGPFCKATVPGSREPVFFGVHDAIADHYGVPRGSEAERTTTTTTWSPPLLGD
ncbi:MAG: hypothetical protein C4306_11120 [Thermoleophilia bacterium]